MGGKVCLRCKGKTLLGVVNKKFVAITQHRWINFGWQGNVNLKNGTCKVSIIKYA